MVDNYNYWNSLSKCIKMKIFLLLTIIYSKNNMNVVKTISSWHFIIPIIIVSIAGTDFVYDCLFCLLLYTCTKKIKLSFPNKKTQNMMYTRMILHQLQHGYLVLQRQNDISNNMTFVSDSL